MFAREGCRGSLVRSLARGEVVFTREALPRVAGALASLAGVVVSHEALPQVAVRSLREG